MFPFWPLTEPFVVHGGGDCSVGPQGIRLATYQDDWLFLAQSQSSAGSRFHGEWGEEYAISSSGHVFARPVPEFFDGHSASLGRAGQKLQGMPCAPPAGQGSLVIIVYVTPDGVCHSHDPDRLPPHD